MDSTASVRYDRGPRSRSRGGNVSKRGDLLRSYDTLAEIRALPDNWNGNGAPRFSPRLLDRICGIVETLPRQPDIFPTANDSIQLEYENSRGDYLEFEIFEDGRIKEFLCEAQGSRTQIVRQEALGETVRRFYE